MKTSTTELLERMPPNDAEAELGVVGGIMLKPDVVDAVAAVVRSDDFYDDANRRLFANIEAMHVDGRKIDRTLLIAELRKSGDFEAIGGAAYIYKVLQAVPNAAHAEHYARVVADLSTLRQMINVGTEIVQRAFEAGANPTEVLAEAEGRVFAIGESRNRVSRAAPIGNSLLDAMDQIDARSRSGKVDGVPTGFRQLDDLTGGMRPGALWIVGARPSCGKTAFALNVAAHVAKREEQTALFVSLEMSAVEISERLLASEGKVNSQSIRSGTISRDDQRRLVEVSHDLADIPLIVDDAPALTVLQIAATARRHKRQGDLRLVVVDYLTLISPADSRAPRQEQVATISRQLKGLARDVEVPVLCLAQLNRQADGQAPRLSHLRESGAIEQDADLVAFLHKPTPATDTIAGDSGPVELIVAKQRSGPTGVVPLLWLPRYVRFAPPAAERCAALEEWSDGSDRDPNEWRP